MGMTVLKPRMVKLLRKMPLDFLARSSVFRLCCQPTADPRVPPTTQELKDVAVTDEGGNPQFAVQLSWPGPSVRFLHFEVCHLGTPWVRYTADEETHLKADDPVRFSCTPRDDDPPPGGDGV